MIGSRQPTFRLPSNNFTQRAKSYLKPVNVRKTSSSRVRKLSFRFVEARPRTYTAPVTLNESFRYKVVLNTEFNFYSSLQRYTPEAIQTQHLWLSQRSFNQFPLNFLSRSEFGTWPSKDFFNEKSFEGSRILGEPTAVGNSISKLSWALPSFLTFTGSTPSKVNQISNSVWEEFIKFNYRSQLYNCLRDLNATIKRERLVFFSFYSFYSDPLTEGTMRKTRLLVPDEQERARSSVYLTGSLGYRPTAPIPTNSTLRPLIKLEANSQKPTRNLYTPRVKVNRRFRMFNCPASALISRVNSQGKETLGLTRPVKLLKRKRRLVRQLARFAKWSKRYRFYKFKRVITWWSRTKARQLKFNFRKLRRKITLQIRLQSRRSRRSYLRGLLSRASRRKLLRRFSIEAPDQKFKRRQKGVFFKPHKTLKRKFSLLKRSPVSTQISFFKNSWVELDRQSSTGSLDPVDVGALATTSPRSTFSPDWSASSYTYKLLAGDTKLFKYTVAKFLRNTNDPFGQYASSSKLFSDLKFFSLRLQNQFETYATSGPKGLLRKSNLWAVSSVDKVIRKRLFRHVTSTVFPVDLSIWYYKTLVQFIENCSGRKSLLLMGPFIQNALTYEDRARCSLWNNRVTGFQRILGSRIFVHEALAIIVTAVRIKDPTFLSNWIRGMLKRLSFWKYRLIFRYVKFVLRYVLKPNFHLLDFRGVKLQLKGKISVAGNARTRTLFMRIGDTSHSKMSNRVAYDLSFVNTFTGILGFKLWFFY